MSRYNLSVKKTAESHPAEAAPLRVGAGFRDFFPDAEPDAVEAVLNILKTATMIQARVTPLTRDFNLTVPEFSVLEALSSAGQPQAPRVISQRLVVPAQTLTNVLDSLEAAGLVRRLPHPTDRRSILIAITDAGRATLHAVCIPVANAETAWLSCLAPDERENLIRLLGRVQAHLSAQPPER
jgi:DNA-binding MarR family transcriptional regulator